MASVGCPRVSVRTHQLVRLSSGVATANAVAYALSRKAMTTLLIQRSEWRIVFDGAILSQLKV